MTEDTNNISRESPGTRSRFFSVRSLGLDRYLARLLMVSFFLPMKLQGLLVIVVGVYFVIRTLVERQKVPAKNYLLALFIGSAYFLFLFAIPFTPHEYLQPLSLMSQQRASFLLMPFVFAIVTPTFGKILLDELMFFVYACFVVCIVANADFVYHVYSSGKGIHAFSHVEYRGMLHMFTDVHPTYMGMYQCFSICILLFTPVLHSRGGAILKYIMLFSLLIFLLAIGPKAPIIALAVIFIHYALSHRAVLWRHKTVMAALLAAIAAVWFFIPFFRQRVMETIQGVEANNGNAIDNSISMRKVIWNVDMSLLKHYWLSGVGPGRVMHTLREHYFFYSLVNPSPVPYHDPHNEYIYQWLCFGILGMVLFTLILFAHLRKAILRKDHLYLYLLIILCITFFTETVLSMQRGVLFYAVFTSLFFFIQKKEPLQS